MTLAYSEAVDEINALFYAAWQANTSAVVGYVPEVFWQGVEKVGEVDGSKFWARFSLQTIEAPQTSLSNCVVSPGSSRYTEVGLLLVQIFCPKSNAQAQEFGRSLAEIARNAVRGKTTPGKVWFRNARILPLPDEELFHRFNVIAEYEYDDIS